MADTYEDTDKTRANFFLLELNETAAVKSTRRVSMHIVPRRHG